MRPRNIYSGIELELASSKVSTKVCGFTFGSISLHLISKSRIWWAPGKRINEILTQKHQYNEKYLSRFKDKNASRKLKKIYMFVPDFRCMHRRMCVHARLHARYIPGRRNSWSIVSWAEIYTGNMILWLTKNRQSQEPINLMGSCQSVFFFLLLKETWIYFNYNIVWQLLQRRPVLIFRTPSHSVPFQNWPPKIKPLRKLYPSSETPPKT